MGVRVFRWTMAYFAAALVSFALAQGIIALGGAYPQRPLSAPATLAVVHLITIGWLTLLILGALQQFVPVITERSLASDGAAGVALALIVVGLAGMVTVFLSLPDGPARLALPAGGTLVAAGVLVATGNLGVGLWRARPLVLPARFVAAGLGFLVLTVAMGLTLAMMLAHPEPMARHLSADLTGRFLSRGLSLHVLAGIGGWFTVTAMGVAYKLLSMFTLAPEDRGPAGRWVLRLTAGGLLLAWSAGVWHLVAGGAGETAAAWLGHAGWIAAGAGTLAYGVDMARLYRSRRRRHLELNAWFAAWALAALGAGVMLVVLAAASGRLAAGAGAIAYLFLFGWLSGLGLSQLYKIVPFLTWIERFGPQLGRGPVVRVQDLVDEPRARPWFILYFGAVAVGTIAGFLGSTEAWRAATGATAVATVAIARELVRARRANPRPAAAPLSPAAGAALQRSMYAPGGVKS